jgi:tetratricopeptide (TPR) repeat protein
MPAYRTQDLYFDVAQVQHDEAGLFGSGRLIARNLILTARHVVTAEGATEPAIHGWRVRLFGAKPKDGGKWEWRDADVVWVGKDKVDLALVSIMHAEGVTDMLPKLKLRAAKIERGEVKVRGIGFPLGSRVDDSRQLMSAAGILKDEARQTLTWGIDPHDIPDVPDTDWAGFSGAAVLLADSSDERDIWIYGVAQQVPGKFKKQLDVARLESAFLDASFRPVLLASGEVAVEQAAEPPEKEVLVQFGYDRQRTRQMLSAEIRAQEQKRIASLDKTEDWRKINEIENARDQQIADLDRLLDGIEQTSKEGEASESYLTASKLLQKKGVAEALAFLEAKSSQRAELIETQKKRLDREEKELRKLLQEELLAASLLEKQMRFTEAEAKYRKVVGDAGLWAEPRNLFAWFLIQRGTTAEPAEGNLKLKEAEEICQGTLALNEFGKSPWDWALAQHNLGNALRALGTRSGAEQGRKLLQDAIAAFRFALEVRTKADLSQSWARTQNDLGQALYELGIRSGAEEGPKLLQDAIAAFRSALEVYTKAHQPQNWAAAQNNLGAALRALGIHSGAGAEEGPKLLQDAVAAFRSALEVYTKADLPQNWAAAQNNLGAALQALGIRSGAEEGPKLVRDAVAAYRSALEGRTKADLPQDWAQTQYNLGLALYEFGTRSGAEECRKLLQDAIAACRSALEVYTKADTPQPWAATQYNLGNVLYELGILSDAQEGRKLLQNAVAAYRSALEVYTKEDLLQDWALTLSHLGNALYKLGMRSGAEEGRNLLQDAVAAYRCALEGKTKADLLEVWARTQHNLGNALYKLGMRSGAEEGRNLVQDAVAAYRSALEGRTKADLPQDWAATQHDLGIVLGELGRRSGGEEGRKLLEDAVAAYRSALEIRTRANLPQDWAATQYNLGNVLYELGILSDAQEGRKLLQNAVAAYRSALEVYTKEDLLQDWALTLSHLGNALYELGMRSGAEEARKLLQDAVAAYRSALEGEGRTKADLPEVLARVQHNLGSALQELGTRSGGEEGRKLLEDAVAAYRSALEVYKRESVELLRDGVSYQTDDLSRYHLASALGGLAFLLILDSQFAEARTRCEEAQRLPKQIGVGVQKSDRDDLMIFIQGNFAHALLFHGHYDEAFAIYRQYWDKPQNGKTFGEVTLEDFAAFDKAGLTHPDLSRMKQALGDLRSNASSP